jgi:hypothetical protein
MYQFLRKQTLNGDGRSLRNAVDDVAADLREHRSDVRDRLGDLKDRIVNLEGRVKTVESEIA